MKLAEILESWSQTKDTSREDDLADEIGEELGVDTQVRDAGPDLLDITLNLHPDDDGDLIHDVAFDIIIRRTASMYGVEKATVEYSRVYPDHIIFILKLH